EQLWAHQLLILSYRILMTSLSSLVVSFLPKVDEDILSSFLSSVAILQVLTFLLLYHESLVYLNLCDESTSLLSFVDQSYIMDLTTSLVLGKSLQFHFPEYHAFFFLTYVINFHLYIIFPHLLFLLAGSVPVPLQIMM